MTNLDKNIAAAAGGYRLGIDIGGTFTDLTLISSDGLLHTKKVPTTPDDYSQAILEGTRAILDGAGIKTHSVVEVSHATTIATNTIIQRKGVKLALITTAGLRLSQDRRFAVDAGDYRVIPAERADEAIIDHYDAAFDRLGFIEDSNVVFPLARLREMAAGGEIGSVAAYHYSFMGAGDLRGMEGSARALASVMKQEGVTTVVLTPV